MVLARNLPVSYDVKALRTKAGDQPMPDLSTVRARDPPISWAKWGKLFPEWKPGRLICGVVEKVTGGQKQELSVYKGPGNGECQSKGERTTGS